MTKKSKPKKTGHKSHDAIMEQDWKAKEGHNSGQMNEDVIGKFEEHERIEATIKALRGDQKAIRVTMKEEYGLPTVVVTRELQERKLDKSVRAEREAAAADLKAMLGYQFALNLIPAAAGGEKDPVEVAGLKVANKKSKSSKKPRSDEGILEGENMAAEGLEYAEDDAA